MSHTVAQLKRLVAYQRGVIAELRAEVRSLRDRKTPLRGIHVRCVECGAEAGEPCVTQDNKPFRERGRRTHHLRGRTGHCGRYSCRVCPDVFGDHGRSLSPGSDPAGTVS